MIFQSYALWPHMTVAENVAYGLKLRKVDRATVDRKLGAILPPRISLRLPTGIPASFPAASSSVSRSRAR